MGHFFDVIVGGDDVKNPKPHPEALIKAVSSLGAAKKDVLYIGDSIIDARTAERAGIDFFAVTTGTTTREDFYPVSYTHLKVRGQVQEVRRSPAYL